jgi:putative ABC transport system permease protein
MIMPAATSYGGVRSESGSGQNLTVDDATAIEQRCPSITATSPIVRTSGQIVAVNQNWRTSVFGGSPEYFEIRGVTTIAGDIFSAGDNKNAAKVCVVGLTVIQNLFGDTTHLAQIIGQSIRINNIPFRIIGVLERKGQNSFGMDQDDMIVAPFYTIQRRMLSITYASQIMASARAQDLIQQGTDEINELLMERHKILPGQDLDFTIRTQADLSAAFSTISNVMSILLTIIASISLLVGGIGIMNIMMVSITERTREIGLRMAVGAKPRIIMFQFLIEAITISLIGGLIGVGIGYGAAMMVKNAMHWPISVSAFSIIISFGFASITGIVFGLYPAWKAAALNPIEALRYE